MRFFSAIVLGLSLAYSHSYTSPYPAISRGAAGRSPLFRHQASLAVSEPAVVHDVADSVSQKIQSVLGKADDLVLSRAMRFVNHAPVIVTLATLMSKLGATAQWRFGLDIAPSMLKLQAPAALGAVPTWVGYCLPIMVVSQCAAVARSALAADGDELSQADISALAVSNFAFTRAITDASPVNWALAAVATGYYARNGHGSEDASIKNLSIQVASSVSTAATVLAAASQLPNVVPFLAGQAELTGVLGLAAILGLATQDGNSEVKRIVNAAILGGILVSKIAGGALQLSTANLFSKGIVVTAAAAYVAAIAVDRARSAIW